METGLELVNYGSRGITALKPATTVHGMHIHLSAHYAQLTTCVYFTV